MGRASGIQSSHHSTSCLRWKGNTDSGNKCGRAQAKQPLSTISLVRSWIFSRKEEKKMSDIFQVCDFKTYNGNCVETEVRKSYFKKSAVPSLQDVCICTPEDEPTIQRKPRMQGSF